MVVLLIASALLLDFFGCMMPLALVEDTKALKVGVFLIWAALVADSVLMGLFYPRELAGVNPLLAAGLESICLICAMYPLHGFASNLAPCGIRVDTVAALAFIDFLVPLWDMSPCSWVRSGLYSSRLAGIWTCRPSSRRVPRSSADAGRLHITPAVGLYDEDIPF